MKCSNTPCRYCPYRKDVPSGVWHADEYLKLPQWDKTTPDQPVEWFGCHAKPGTACTGWINASLNAPKGHEYLAVRFLVMTGNIEGLEEFRCDTNMFLTGKEACAHGMADIDNPSDEAIEAQEYLNRMIEGRSR